MMGVVEQFGIDWVLVAAETVNFLVVLAILYFFVFKRVSSFLDERSNTIKEGVENAEKAEEMLASAETEKAAIITDAQREASDTIAASVEKGKERESDIIASAGTKADEILQNAKQKGETEKQNIIDSSKDEIAKLITLGAEKILSQK